MTIGARISGLALPLAFALAATIAATLGCSGSTSPGGSGGFLGGQGGQSGLGGSTGAGTGGSQTDAGFPDSGGFGGNQGAAGTLGGIGGSGQGGALGGCVVTPTMLSPPDRLQLEAYPGARARVRATARGAPTTSPSFVWTVTFKGQENILTTPALPAPSGAQSEISFPVVEEGSYRIDVYLAGVSCQVNAIDAVAQRAVFLLRASVPGIPLQEKQLNLVGTDPRPKNLSLDPGALVRVAPRRSDGGDLTTFVRVTPPASALGVSGGTQNGALTAWLFPSAFYDVLVIPDAALAPVLFTSTPSIWQADAMLIDQGIPIRVTTLDGNNRPLAGVHMIMRRGQLPSTVGASDAAGRMTLLARAGTLVAYLAPPDDSGLPQAIVGDAAAAGGATGVVVGDVDSLDVQMTWKNATTAPLTVQVRAPDGVTRVAGARVRVTSSAPPAVVGTLVARTGGGAAVSSPAVGSIDVEATTDATGSATFAALALGGFSLTVIPPPGGAADAGITAMPVTLARAGQDPMVTVTLAQKVRLSGVVRPVADSAGATITAIDGSIAAPGRVVTATVGGDGSYTLLVDPARAYQLTIDTVSATAVARAHLGAVTSGTADTTVPDRDLPAPHPMAGILSSQGAAVAGARLQLYCPAWSAQCPNPDFALADVVTDSAGRFALRVPEPPSPR